MAARHWVGGTAAWDGTAGSKWSLTNGGTGNQAVPTTSDDVFFDSGSTGTCTISAGNTGCNSLNCTGHTGTITGSATLTVAGKDASGNSLLLVAGGTYTYNGVTTFSDTSGTTNKITFAGKDWGSFTFDGVGGKWQLQDANVNSSSRTWTLTNGSLDFNSQAIALSIFSSNVTNTRSLLLGSAAIRNNGGNWTVNATGLTFTQSGSSITWVNANATTFTGGGLSYGTISVTYAGNTFTIADANTYAALSYVPGGASNNGNLFTLPSGLTQTVTGTFTVTGGSGGTNRAFVASSTLGSAATVSAGTVTLTDVDFRDVTASGAASPFGGTRIGDALGNTNITATGSVSRFWVAFSGGNWSATSSWSATSNGSSGASVPLPQDSVTIDSHSITSGSRTITMDMSRIGGDVDMGGVTNTPIVTIGSPGNTAPRCFGNLTFGTHALNGNAAGNALILAARSAKTFTPGTGTTAGTNANVISLGDALSTGPGTVTFSGAATLPATTTLTLQSGTLDLNSTSVSTGLFTGSNSNTRAINNPGSTITLTGTGTVFNFTTTTNLTATWPTTIDHTNSSATACTWTGPSTSGGRCTSTLKRSAGSGTLTITATSFLGGIDTTGWTGTTLTGTADITGNYTGVSSMTSATTLTLSMTGTSGVQQLTMGSASTALNLTINNTGTSVQLQDTFTSTIALTLTAGTLDANSHTPVTVPSLSSSNSNARAITNLATLALTGTGTVISCATATNFSTWPTTIDHNNASATACTWQLGNTAGATCTSNIKRSAGSGNLTITATGTCGGIDLTGYTGTTVTGGIHSTGNFVGVSSLTSATTLTLRFVNTSGTVNLTMGSTATSLVLCRGFSAGAGVGGTTQLQDTLTLAAALQLLGGTLDCNSKAITVNTLTVGSGSNSHGWLNAPATLTITSTGGVITVQGSVVTSGTWPTTIDHNNASATACTWAGISNNPIPSTTTIKRSAGSGSLSISALFAGSVNLTGYTGTTVTGSSSLSGNFTGVSSLTSATTLTLTMVGTSGTQQLTMGSTSTALALTINGSGGTTQLQDTFTSTGAATLTAGNINLNNHTFTPGSVTYNGTSGTFGITSGGATWARAFTLNGVGGTVQLSDAFSASVAITITAGTLDANVSNLQALSVTLANSANAIAKLGTGTWTLTGTATVWSCGASAVVTAGGGTIKINDASATQKTFAGAGKTYWNLWLTGAGTGVFNVTGNNTFNQFKADTPPHTITFADSSTQTIADWQVRGTAGNLMTINTVTGGVACNIVSANAVRFVTDYVSLKDNHLS